MTGSKRLSAIILVVVVALFLISWIVKGVGYIFFPVQG